MKSIFALILVALSSTSYGAYSPNGGMKEYSFKYSLKGDSLEIRRPAQSYEDAFEAAAQQCFNYYKGSEKIGEQRGLDIIDVCANPRS